MSELMNTRHAERDFRWQLLTTASTLALLAAVYCAGEAGAADQDADRPSIWIELGGQLEQMQDGQEPFAPAFIANFPNNFFSPLNVQKPLQFSVGEEGAISFQPEGSDWVFSGSARFGRSSGVRHWHQQTPNAKVPLNIVLPPPLRTEFHFYAPYVYGSYYPNHHVKFADATVRQSETHVVLDFQAGKDVGLGLFGNRGSSVLSAGVRFAQFSSKTNVNLHAEPDLQYPVAPITGTLYTAVPKLEAFEHPSIHFHDYAAMETNQRSFRGLGPSLAWKASAPFAGSPESVEIAFDWGANAAILFGRQRTSVRHKTVVNSYFYNTWHRKDNACTLPENCEKTGHFQNRTMYDAGGGGAAAHYSANPTAHHTSAPPNSNRMRSVTVPNFGAFAGLSLKWPNAKISLGYRADLFFGPMDGGIDTAKSENRAFYGPFASVSIGVGG